MKRYTALFVMLLSISIAAQQPAPPKQPSAAAAPKAPPAPSAQAPAPPQPPNPNFDALGNPLGGEPINVRLDVSVVDQADTATNQPKTLMVMLADRAVGQTRGAFEDRSISVDATPTIIGSRVRIHLRIESRADTGPGKNPDRTLFWQNSFALLLDSGKPMIAFETSDPATKRKLSIEVKATIQK